MSVGLIGKKVGMTRVFTEDGASVPVTVVSVEENIVTQKKTVEIDGYAAIQVAVVSKLGSKRISKAEQGHLKKVGVGKSKKVVEFRLSEENDCSAQELGEGAKINVSLFSEGEYVDVQAKSKGKGYAGTVKRWNFKTQDATHGNSLSHRAPGSIGQCQTPGRVFKGKKMAGQLGNKVVTVQNLKIERIEGESNLIMIKGAVPGAPGSELVITKAVKMKK